jgi:cell division ATPase FtsA
VEYAKHRFRLPVSIGTPIEIDTVIDQVLDPSFATVVGLALWGGNYSSGYFATGFMSNLTGLWNHKFVLKLKQWFKSFMP